MADEVKTPDVATAPVKEEKEAPKAEKKTARGRKKTEPAKAEAATKVVKKPAGRKPKSVATVKTEDKKEKKVVEKKTKATAKKAAPVVAPEIKYDVVYELDGKSYSEKDFSDKVMKYIKEHPYIAAHDVKLFVKPGDKMIYFQIDGCNNADFKVEL